MGERFHRGPDVSKCGGIDLSRGSPDFRGWHGSGALEVVEVEAGIDLIIATEELCTKANAISGPGSDLFVVRESGFEFVVFVSGGAGGDDMKALISGGVGVVDNDGLAMRPVGAEGAPFVGG